MPAYIALLRAVNVGGTGKLPMAELKAMCAAEGFTKIKTYIASSNVVFAAKQSALKVKAALEKRLQAHAEKRFASLSARRTKWRQFSNPIHLPYPQAYRIYTRISHGSVADYELSFCWARAWM